MRWKQTSNRQGVESIARHARQYVPWLKQVHPGQEGVRISVASQVQASQALPQL